MCAIEKVTLWEGLLCLTLGSETDWSVANWDTESEAQYIFHRAITSGVRNAYQEFFFSFDIFNVMVKLPG